MRIIRLKLTGVKNFGEVTPILYRGAQASPEGLGNLKEMGIQIIVDLRGRNHGDERRVEGLGMQYVPIGGTCFPQRDSSSRGVPVDRIQAIADCYRAGY